MRFTYERTDRVEVDAATEERALEILRDRATPLVDPESYHATVGAPRMADWTRIPDGEYNEQFIRRDGGEKLTLYSDRDGTRWSFYVDDGGNGSADLDAADEASARAECLREADAYDKEVGR